MFLTPNKLLTLPNRRAFWHRLLIREQLIAILWRSQSIPWADHAWHRSYFLYSAIVLQKISKLGHVFSALEWLPENLPWMVQSSLMASRQVVIDYWHRLSLTKSRLIVHLKTMRNHLLNVTLSSNSFRHLKSWWGWWPLPAEGVRWKIFGVQPIVRKISCVRVMQSKSRIFCIPSHNLSDLMQWRFSILIPSIVFLIQQNIHNRVSNRYRFLLFLRFEIFLKLVFKPRCKRLVILSQSWAQRNIWASLAALIYLFDIESHCLLKYLLQLLFIKNIPLLGLIRFMKILGWQLLLRFLDFFLLESVH